TPGFADAAPPDSELTIAPASDQPPDSSLPDPPVNDPPSVAPETGELMIFTTAASINFSATPIDDAGQPVGSPVNLGMSPIAVELAPGRWRLETEGRGYQPWSQEVEIVTGGVARFQFEPELIEGALLELRAVDETSQGAA